MLLFCIFLVYFRKILVDFLAQKVNFNFRFCPLVKSMISLYKLNMRGLFLFINSEIFGQHSVGIETVFATNSDTPTHNLEVLVQANIYALNAFSTWKITLTQLPLPNANSVIVIFYVERTLMHMHVKCVVKMLTPDLKTGNIRKQNAYTSFTLNRRSWDFKPQLEKVKPTLIDSFLDNPNPLITNVSAHKFRHCLKGLGHTPLCTL